MFSVNTQQTNSYQYMGRSQESFNKKEVRKNKEKKRQDKEKKRLARKDGDKNSFEDMIAYVDANGQITSTPPDLSNREETKLEDIEISVQKRSDEEIDPVRTGIVTYFNTGKGYGFIRDMESKESIFVHANNLQQEIQQDNKVNFEIEKGPKGFNAINVKLAK